MERLLQGLRAAAEPTRLRIMALCSHGELTVSDLTNILNQSQPRVSRHLKLLVDAGLLERFREGAWAYYRLAETSETAELSRNLVDFVPVSDGVHSRDLERLQFVKQERADQAAAFFRENAARWDKIRTLYIDDQSVESALIKALSKTETRGLLDIGTGTGRILEIFGESIERGIGVDLSHEMLSVARVNLEQQGLRNCHVRYGDMNDLPLDQESFDAVTFHLALHYAEDPSAAIKEATRFLNPGGQLVVVDFAPHEEEGLRDEHAHRWLGFDDDAVFSWFADAGLEAERPIRLPGDPLTVCIWPAVRNDVAVAASGNVQSMTEVRV